MSVPLSVHPQVQMLSADPGHEPDGAWLSRRCRVLKISVPVDTIFRLTVFMELTVIWTDDLVNVPLN